jgi:predicted nucleotidyltransferase
MARHRVPRTLLDPIVKYFKPQSVILFGSRARGAATRDSDIDLLVIVAQRYCRASLILITS